MAIKIAISARAADLTARPSHPAGPAPGIKALSHPGGGSAMPLTALPVRLPLEDASLSLPRISVILPAYNRAEQISRAIDSVLAQELGDFELIVVDDGSTDETVQLVKQYQDERVRLVELRENGGSNAARNAGIRAVSASLIAFLDSDDFYLPQKLGSVVREFDKRHGLDVLVDSF